MFFSTIGSSQLFKMFASGATFLFAFVFLLSIVVFIHELGHYFFAKLFKVKIETFSIGFGKKLLSKFDKTGTEWCLSIIPFGGYVKMYGESNIESDTLSNKRDVLLAPSMLKSKTYMQKLFIVLGGPIFNFIFAFVILCFLYMFYPKIIVSNVIEYVDTSGIAYQNGVREGDAILYVNDQIIYSMHDVNRIFMMNKNIDFSIIYKSMSHVGEHRFIISKQEIADKEKLSQPILGVSGEISQVERNFFDAAYDSAHDIVRIIGDTAIVIKQIISIKRDTSELGGPIKIAKYSNDFFKAGLQPFLWFIAMVSINLGFMNLLPIPILDGGMALFYTFQKIFGETISNSIFKIYYTIGIAFVFLLTIFVTFNDMKFLFYR